MNREQSERSVTARRVLSVVVCMVPVVILVIAAWNRRWMSDDGFINLRVISQIKAGHGPVFNEGQRVEVATSPLWLWVLFVADLALPLRLEWIAVSLGIASAVAAVVIALVASARLSSHARGETWLFPLGALVVVVLSPMWDFASSGLEIGLALFWLALCLTALVRWRRSDAGLALPSAVLLGLGPLIRPDFLVFSAIFLIVVIVGEWRSASKRRLLAVAACWASIPFAYEIFRMGYYGALVPNTAFAKEAGRSSWAAGWGYFTNFVLPYWLWVPIVALLAAFAVPQVRMMISSRDRRGVLIVTAFVAGAIVHASYVVRVGGDYMHGRLLLPSLFALVAPFAVVRVPRRATAIAATTVVIAWAVVCVVAFRPPKWHFGQLVWDDRTVAVDQVHHQHPVTVASHADVNLLRHLRKTLYTDAAVVVNGKPIELAPGVPTPIVMTDAIGAISYAAGPNTFVLDGLGLGDVFTAHLQLQRRGIPGHEKSLPPHYAIARLVAPGAAYDPQTFNVPILVEWRRGMNPSEFNAYVRAQNSVPLAQRVALSRQLMSCPGIEHLLAPSTARLTPKRFVENLVDAFRFYDTRIPYDPATAVRQFC